MITTTISLVFSTSFSFLHNIRTFTIHRSDLFRLNSICWPLHFFFAAIKSRSINFSSFFQPQSYETVKFLFVSYQLEKCFSFSPFLLRSAIRYLLSNDWMMSLALDCKLVTELKFKNFCWWLMNHRRLVAEHFTFFTPLNPEEKCFSIFFLFANLIVRFWREVIGARNNFTKISCGLTEGKRIFVECLAALHFIMWFKKQQEGRC